MAGQCNKSIGEHEVVGVERKAVVPALIPTRQMTAPQEAIEHFRHEIVRTGIATSCRRIRQQCMDTAELPQDNSAGSNEPH